MDAHEGTVQSFSCYLMARSPAPQITALAQDHSVWWHQKLVAMRVLRTKDLSLCPSCLRTCLAGWSAFSIQTEHGLVEIALSRYK